MKLVATVNHNKTQITKNNKMMAFAEVEDRSGACEIIVFPNVLEEARSALYAGAVVEIEGTLSMKEDEEPRVLADQITALPPAAQLKVSAAQPRRPVEQPVQIRQDQTLYLKVPSLESEAYLKAKNILEIFGGNTRVVFYLSESKKQLLAPQSLWTHINPTMLGELQYQLGAENVILK